MAAPDMSPKAGKPLVQNDAGSYLAWSGKDQPALAGEKLGCGLLVLKPLGFALPHYADSGKFGYVLGGSAVVGVLPVGVDSRERVVRLEAGDVIAMRAGEVTWWYNDADGGGGEDVTILLVGDTAGAVSPGDFSYFILDGPMGVLGGLDAGLLATASGLTSPEQAATAFRSQPAALLTRLSRKLHGVRPREHDRHGIVTGDGALHREGIGDRRPDAGDSAGGAQRVAGVGGAAQDQVNAGSDLSGDCVWLSSRVCVSCLRCSISPDT
uniref:Cupin type-1 domain-containing protein n=1 Tax=Oryza barthii TaxID=65489 RepID=A0A0D3H9T2_9ORYZ